MRKYIPEVPPAFEEDFPAFAAHDLEVQQGDRVRRVKLYLPAREEVDQLLKRRSEAVHAEVAAAHQAAEFAKDEAERKTRSRKIDEAFSFSPRKGADQHKVNDARAELKFDYDDQLDALNRCFDDERDRVQILAWDEPIKLLDPLVRATPDRDIRERDRDLYNHLKKLGAFRFVSKRSQLCDQLRNLKALRLAQPHFGKVIDLIEGQIGLALEMAKPLKMPPILLAGPPGVGKTYFTLELARSMLRPIRRHSFDAAHTAASLMGSARNWANTQPGVVFDAVCMGDRADPILLLDELDKAQTFRDCNPLGPLHSLLEPVTSSAVSDLSAGITFDASHIFWIATVNDLLNVPGPIQSRFRIFHIQTPSAEQAIDLAQTVAASVHLRFAAFEPPAKRVITLLAHLTPREQIQALEQAFGRALVNGRRHLVRQDLPAAILDGDAGDPTTDSFLH